MTGRAGRRGKDKVGFSIFIPGPFQDINLIVDLLAREPEPIESQFSANYTMVLNLLQQTAAKLLTTYTGEKLTIDFRSHLFRHVQRLSLAYHDSAGTTE